MREPPAIVVVDRRVAVGAVLADQRVEAQHGSAELHHDPGDQEAWEPRLVGMATREDLAECDRGEDSGGGDEDSPDGRVLHAAGRRDHHQADRRKHARDEPRPVGGRRALESGGVTSTAPRPSDRVPQRRSSDSVDRSGRATPWMRRHRDAPASLGRRSRVARLRRGSAAVPLVRARLPPDELLPGRSDLSRSRTRPARAPSVGDALVHVSLRSGVTVVVASVRIRPAAVASSHASGAPTITTPNGFTCASSSRAAASDAARLVTVPTCTAHMTLRVSQATMVALASSSSGGPAMTVTSTPDLWSDSRNGGKASSGHVECSFGRGRDDHEVLREVGPRQVPRRLAVEDALVCELEQLGQVALAVERGREVLEVPGLTGRGCDERHLKAEVGECGSEVGRDVVVACRLPAC